MARFDLVVIGAGPAGAAAAHAAARGGARVALLEKARLPRYKPCGGCVSARTVPHLPAEIGSVVEDVTYGATFTLCGRGPIRTTSARPMAYMVMRDRFDARLAEAAAGAGADLRDGEAALGVEERRGAVLVRAGREAYEAAFVVLADGITGLLGRRGARRAGELPPMFALEAEVPAGPSSPDLRGGALIDIAAAPRGYAWAFPKAAVTSVGIMGDRRRMGRPQEALRRFADAQGALDLPATVRGSHVPVFGAAVAPVRGRTLRVGDAAGLVDPFLGEGIFYAVRSGQLAAEVALRALGEGPRALGGYARALGRLLYPDLRAARWLARIIHWAPAGWHRLLATHPGAVELFADVLRGEHRYREFVGLVARQGARRWLALAGAAGAAGRR
jgi:geranylgeranyl reductase family protein